MVVSAKFCCQLEMQPASLVPQLSQPLCAFEADSGVVFPEMVSFEQGTSPLPFLLDLSFQMNFI